MPCFYLLFLRLTPIFPFFVVNLAPAFLGVRLPLYAWTTFVGIFPGTLVYTFIGAGLGKALEGTAEPSLENLVSTEILLGLGGLGAMSLLAVVVRRVMRRRSGGGVTSAPTAVEARNLSKEFDGRTVVDRVSFAVPRGTTFGLLGANGAGKTTTILMLLGLLRPDRGEARVLGHDMEHDRFRALPARQLLVALRQPAAPADGQAEPDRVRPALRRCRRPPPH